jgi:hypothetical protein
MTSYKPLVYKDHGGDRLVVASGGTIAIEAGGTITSADPLYSETGFREYVETAVAATTTLVNYGVSMILSTGTSQHVYSLAAPVAGIRKYISCNNVNKSTGSSTGAAIVTSSGASAAFGAYTSILFSTGSANTQFVSLVGQNSTNWIVTSYSTDVSFSAT